MRASAQDANGRAGPTTKAARYPIRAVSKLTGVAIDTLRAWERRYGAVAPRRDRRGRLYTEADVTRLRLLSSAVAAGHSVGRIAALGDAQLRDLAAAPRVALRSASRARDDSRLRAALDRLDSAALDLELSRLAVMLPPLNLVRDVLLPALSDIGEEWRRRVGGIADEHMMSAAMRHLLGSFLRLYSHRPVRARLLFTTPSGERHEVGILGAAMLAASQGMAVSYLGPDLPARAIVEAVKRSGAHVLVLGLTLAGEGTPRERELGFVLRHLPQHIEVWVGGPGAASYARVLGTRGNTLDLDSYLRQLSRLSGGT